jgi:hypothetical protein
MWLHSSNDPAGKQAKIKEGSMSISPKLQSWLDMRGITCSNDPEFVKLVPWLRFTVVLCGTMMGLGTGLAFTPLLWAMVPIAGLGGILPRHPFDLLYNYGLRHLTGTLPLPRNGAPTRFACGIASVWLVATALAFTMGVAWLGYLLGGALTSVAAIVSVSHFCIPSLIYQLLFGDRAVVYRALFSWRQAESA